MERLGVLKRLSPKTLWPGEATDFTPWLAGNLERLGQALGIELEMLEEEASVGDFSVDIVARDLATNRNVVIENQWGSTNHDHLGKILTYAAGLDAGAVIWVAESIREEHRQALDWLNQRTSQDTAFFGVVVELLQIDDSQPAVNFKPVVFPNEWQKTTHASTDSKSPKGQAYQAFFQELIDELREKYKFTKAKAGQPQCWYSFASGISGLTYGMSFAFGDKARAELYIDVSDQAENKRIFDALHSRRAEIEKEMGMPLEWEKLEDRRASRIATYRPGSIQSDPSTLESIKEWGIANLLKFKKVFAPYIQQALRNASEGTKDR
jgi:hypothetical protein